MALIDNTNPGELTDEQKIERTIERIRARSSALFHNIKASYSLLLEEVINNPDGLSREAITNAIVAEIPEFFELGADLRNLINQASPGAIPDPNEEPEPTPEPEEPEE